MNELFLPPGTDLDEIYSKMFGNKRDEYNIYVESAQSLGWSVKSYDEWLIGD
tara:strand:+ start:1189 stop:1344 length:156 start_codon:yes stop_codon:yes gene_type:complete